MHAPLDPATLLHGLNDRQREAVQAIEGPVLVLAGPGSGKTRVLTHRVAWLVGVAGVPPWHILAVTFTNKAAREMTERLVALIGRPAVERLTAGTFHAICARILRREAGQALGFDANFVIFDTDDQLKVVRNALEALNLDPKTYRANAILGAISNAKNELIRPADYVAQSYWHEVAGRVYHRYQAGLRESNALDFDDLLLETACLMRDDAAVRARYQERYPFLMVDEFQDTNTAQYALLKALAAADTPEAPHNLFVVGDEDQSIYRWRGADWRNIQRFRQDFPGCRTILLEQNYRSTQTILDAAQAIIDRNAHRTRKALWTESGGGTEVTVFECYDETEEATYIVREIERRVAAGASYADFAVMYRTNAQSRAIEDAFVRWRVPYQLVGGTRFYDRREIRDVLAYLRFVHNPMDVIALERIVNVPPRNIGPKAWAALVDWARALGATLWDTLGYIASETDRDAHPAGAPALDGRTRNALVRFHDIMAGLMAARATLPVPQLLEQVLEAGGYAAWLRDGTDEGEERWENVRELRGVALDFESLAPGDGLAAFLESVALVSDVDSLDGRAGARVTLLTLHAAKGLEFAVVFITGVEEDRLPHARAADDAEGLAEERRLFYVGLTRAREKLYLLHTFRRTLYGTSEVSAPSRFLSDIPPHLVEGRPAARGGA
ncbi:DNA helicase UvrD, partial [bacterium]